MPRQPAPASPAIMVELRNLRRLHAADRQTKAALRAALQATRAEITVLRRQLKEQAGQIDTQAVQIAELRQMVFGRRRRPQAGDQPPPAKPPAKTRSRASYRRPVPPPEAVTETRTLPLPDRCPCGGQFGPGSFHQRFEEDIPLPDLTPAYQARLVTRYRVERAVCTGCGRASAGPDGRYNLGGQPVVLGQNVRLLVCHLAAMGLSYSQTTHLLTSLYSLAVSSGEIAAIIQRRKQLWTPAYQQLLANIRASPALHIDETPWPVQSSGGGGYAWVMAAADGPEVCFDLAPSRGARVAQKLLDGYAGIRIADDYAVYRNRDLPGRQQLCWAHLFRTGRDLRYNSNLPPAQRPFVQQWYRDLAAVYRDLRAGLARPFDRAGRAALAGELQARVDQLAGRPVPPEGIPDKLVRLRAQLARAGRDKLFLCLEADAPADNNRAERELRPLVLKRKRSFGSKTQKGADALAVVMSLCTTTWRQRPNSYFQGLAALG